MEKLLEAEFHEYHHNQAVQVANILSFLEEIIPQLSKMFQGTEKKMGVIPNSCIDAYGLDMKKV